MHYKKKQLETWRLLYNSLQNNIPSMLLFVLDSQGSSPGRKGFMMAVNTKGDISGSIGGGIMEQKFVELAKERLQHSSMEISVMRQLHDKTASKNQSGMICSGEQTILFCPVIKIKQPVISNIITCLENNDQVILQLSKEGIAIKDSSALLPVKPGYYFTDEENWTYTEKLGYYNKIYIIGGGHCSLALSSLLSTMDFYITIFDDRNDLNTMMENTFAHKLLHIQNYTKVVELIPEGDHIFVVIMTSGYRSDDLVLRSIMNKKFGYIGLLGSKAKVKKMFDDYRKEGISESILQWIHAPIGVPIKSQTPEEIAVSIAAEIIMVKRSL